MPRLLIALLILLSPTAAAARAIDGRWLTDDGSAIIRLGPCGGKLCGTIERVLDPAAPTQDINNPDPVQRGRPLVGTPVLSGFAPSEQRWTGGTAYDPKTGRSYRSRLALDGRDLLRVTGCVLFVCRTRIWSRVR